MSLFNLYPDRDINEGVVRFRSEEDAVLLDVRTREEYADGHIKGSLNLPLDEIDRAAAIFTDKERPLYVHCLSGRRSAHAAAYLRAVGYSSVRDIGGIRGWRGELVV